MRVVWTARALRDLASLRDYVVQDDPAAAECQVERILAAAARLAEFPETGRPGRRAETRELVVSRTPYLMPYASGANSSRCCASFTGGSAGRMHCEGKRQTPA
jgi:plasmid stabilization system protein ParE